MPYSVLQRAFDALVPPGLQWYWKVDIFEEITDEATAIHRRYGEAIPTPLSTMHMYPISGAAARVPEDATAFAYRNGGWVGVFRCRVNECRQEPWPDDALKNDEGNLAQPTGRGCCGLDDHFVLTACLRQPRQNVSLLDHGEERVTRHKRARGAHGRQLASHRGLSGPRRSRYDDQFAHCSIVLDPCCGGASND